MKVILLLSLFFLQSCDVFQANEKIDNYTIPDSIHNNYVSSKNKDLSLNEKLDYINKAINQSYKINSDTLTLFYKSRQSTIYGQLKDYTLAITSASDLLRLAKQLDNNKYKALATKKLGRYFFKIKDYKNAYYNYNLSYEYYKPLKDSLKLSDVLFSIAEIEKNKGLYKLSEESTIKSLTYLPLNSKKRANFYNLLSITQREQFKFKESLIWSDSALYANDKSNSSYNSRNKKYLNSKALTLRENNEFKKASFIFSELIKTKDSLRYARYLSNYAYCRWKQDSTINVEKQLIESLKIRENRNDSLGLIASYKHLSDFFEKKDLKRFKHYSYKFYEISKKKEALKEQIEALNKLVNIETNNEKKETYLEKIIDLEDYQKDQLKQVVDEFAAIRFDTKLKETKIISLEQLNETLRYKNYVYILLTIMTLFTTVFLIYYFRQRKKQIQLQERYQTETRLSKKIHDEVGNDVFYLMAQIENDPSLLEKNGLKLLDDLQNIYSKVRDISREYTDIDTGEGFPEELLSLLSSFKNKKVNIITKQLDSTFWMSIDKELKTEVFRIVQELLTNMKKHSQATFVGVTFKKNSQKLTIQYSDNGIGMKDSFQKLNSVENRIQVLKGVITLDTKPNEGLNLIIDFPL